MCLVSMLYVMTLVMQSGMCLISMSYVMIHGMQSGLDRYVFSHYVICNDTCHVWPGMCLVSMSYAMTHVMQSDMCLIIMSYVMTPVMQSGLASYMYVAIICICFHTKFLVNCYIQTYFCEYFLMKFKVKICISPQQQQKLYFGLLIYIIVEVLIPVYKLIHKKDK